MRRHVHAIAPMLALVIALSTMSAVAAQPTTPTASDGEDGVLAQFSLDALPTPHTEIWLLRHEMGSGSALPAARQIGPVVIVVETGAITLATDRPIEVAGGGSAEPGGSAVATPASDGMIETRLTASQAALISDGTTVSVRNDGDTVASILDLSMYAAARESELEGGEPEGDVRSQMLAVTVADLSNGPGSVVIERVTFGPGAADEVSLPGGGEVGVLENGSATLTIAQGQGFIWPQALTMDPNVSPERQPIRAGSSVELTAGDGYGYSAVIGTWAVPDASDGVTILRARVTPVGN